MKHPIQGLHHVTATVGDAQADLDFYRGGLGLRLIKKTVNFDNHNVYHLYYGDERGTPGTIWTTFPYKGWGVPPGQHGEGQITLTSFSVPASSLSFWKERLRARGVEVREATAFGEEALAFSDPSGLSIQLIGTRDRRAAWTGSGIAPDDGVRGLHSVTLSVDAPAATVVLLSEVLGFEVVDEEQGRIRLAVNARGPGKTIEILYGSGAPRARNGLGTVHHVALAIDGLDQQLRLREELLGRGLGVTDVLDRQYFQSIYFREPGGVLLEVATISPGFTVDETLADLGRDLKLPPWEEPHRVTIERGLPRVTSQ
ncbi:MAG TPA: ring-cleaving dioxygenase [Gemmatimonadales bacterium]|jgi:glyoxalase family protein|nr:ring-cleaving dioxygenase [Gemmatimonadales bacterium]